MTTIQTKSEARTLSGADSEEWTLSGAGSPECGAFFVFHSPDVSEETKLDIRPSRGSLHRPDEHLYIEAIEARILAASAATSEGYESQEAESNPDGSELKMDSSVEDRTWAYYPNSMQVWQKHPRIDNRLAIRNLTLYVPPERLRFQTLQSDLIHKKGTDSYPVQLKNLTQLVCQFK